MIAWLNTCYVSSEINEAIFRKSSILLTLAGSAAVLSTLSYFLQVGRQRKEEEIDVWCHQQKKEGIEVWYRCKIIRHRRRCYY